MVDRSAGSASIRIKPDATRFVADLRRDLASKQGDFVLTVSADTDKFSDKVDRVKREASKPVASELELDVREAENELRALRIRERAKKLGIEVDVDADPARAELQLRMLRAREEARKIELAVDVDTRDASGKLSVLNKHLNSFRKSDFLRLNLGAGLLAGIQPAVAGLAQVAAGLQQVTQAGIAIPGVMASASASIGTLVLGLSGIKDAWDAVADASGDAGKDQAAQARASAAASRTLRNAVVDEAQGPQGCCPRDPRRQERAPGSSGRAAGRHDR